MLYHDLIYGQFEINEPAVLELLNSPWLRRLKGVNQGGYPPLFTKPNAKLIASEHHRLAHSLGVYLLLKKYGAPLEEQIAGLMHDVSHSTFSHVIDYVLEHGSGKEQNHQDNSFKDFIIRKTDLPKIIKRHGLSLEYILDDKNFPLKENNIPDVCADRLDYILREGVIFEEINQAEARRLADGLLAENNQWIFKNFFAAKQYAELFLKLNLEYYSAISAATMFLALSDLLKHAIQKKYADYNDFYTNDQEILKKIKRFLGKDEKLGLLWRRANDSRSISQSADKYDAEIFCKSRIVDPLFKDNGRTKRLSEAFPVWSEIVKRELKPKQYFLKYNY